MRKINLIEFSKRREPGDFMQVAADKTQWVPHDRTAAAPAGLVHSQIWIRRFDGPVSFLSPDKIIWSEVIAYSDTRERPGSLSGPVELQAVGAKSGIGDVSSDAIGSGARFNSGKPPMELIPISMIAAFYGDNTPAKRALKLLGLWQEGGGQDVLIQILRELSPGAWGECAKVFDYGRGKYAEWNWAKGMPWSVPLACAARHLQDMIEAQAAPGGCEALDKESGLPHRGHVACNVVMLWTYHRTYLVGDDRPAPHLLTMKATAP